MTSGAENRSVSPTPALVDSHVHLYAGFQWSRFFRAAWQNFERARRELSLEAADYVLCFTEDARHDTFGDLVEAGAHEDLEISTTADPAAVEIRHREERLLVISGRQIITGEGLELLALGTRATIPDGISLLDGVDQVRRAEAIPVVPWAFGKWWGRRGRVLHAALVGGAPVELGDNSGRLSVSGDPEMFRLARSLGKLVLPGTDPLPLPHHETRAGTYGFVLEQGLSETRPARDLVGALNSRERRVLRRFGRRVGIVPFVRDQVALRVRKVGS
ncbi:MAG: hypothetical protein R3E12_08815 [Candidatus Eisenbacteria bacterium]|uniref:Uncharacterized protein n=1 Tax=Eiseniibacteriota bacterium TaxID=2212470 RepID=A0A956RMK2_UNCEI|nr:hypothetical protein [Candidatus Eisenbacteria bacterium]